MLRGQCGGEANSDKRWWWWWWWCKFQFWRFVFVQQVIGWEIQTFRDLLSPRTGARFNLDAVPAEIAKRMAEAASKDTDN